MDNMIEIHNLSKSFGDIKAVNGIDFKVRRGELFALLGVNGAGKSTTISIICGQLSKDGGCVEVCGRDIEMDTDTIKSEIGVVFQNSVLDTSLTVKDNLRSRAALYGIHGKEFSARLDELSALLDLAPLLSRTLGKLSGGQRRRIDIARALLHRPKILILDEPTTGLDPQTRRAVWEVIDKLRREEDMTVLLTTHYMEEAADADYIVILDAGKVAAHGTPIELKNKYTGDFITLYNLNEEKVKSLGIPYEKIKDSFRISVTDTSEATKLIISAPELFSDYEIVKGKMDDVFLSVTGKSLYNNDSAENKGGKKK